MSNGNGGLSKIGTILTVIFVVSLAALLLELFYVLWRRRVFYRRQSTTLPNTTDQLSENSSSESPTFSPIASSKELLYFLCIRPQAIIEGNSGNETSIVTNGVNTNNQELDMEVIDLMKIHGMFGPPRFLFTIKEEEKEDMDSPAGKSNSTEKKKNKSGVSLEDFLINEAKEEESMVKTHQQEEEEEEESMVVVDIVDDVATPFSTPCASPLYFTPSNSPNREEVVVVVNDQSTSPFERLQV